MTPAELLFAYAQALAETTDLLESEQRLCCSSPRIPAGHECRRCAVIVDRVALNRDKLPGVAERAQGAQDEAVDPRQVSLFDAGC